MTTTTKGRVKKASVGDLISFTRHDCLCEGTVYKVQDNSVLVTVSKEIQHYLGIDNQNTVVSHKNYTVV